ncbi:MAG: fructose bisphosphate aldolase [Rhodobacteraceae bacterium]|nr:fructose bisphosphate aldolase [Paracoccaceae bacterium]
MSRQEQAQRMRTAKGFIAALDQSGGSTPKALGLYGIGPEAYADEAEMFRLIHEMRARIATAPAFDGSKVIGAILFERTMDDTIGGKPSARFLWEERGVVPFLKVDQGLQDANDGVKLMKPIAGLDALLKRANDAGIFGTKMRSVIDAASRPGIAANVTQQFDIAGQILDRGLMPIIEPEVTISIADKAAAEDILREEILRHLDALPAGRQVILKLTLPSTDNHYKPLIDHPKVMRVVALSGGYSRDQANALLARNTGMIASFSRALTEGLSVRQDDATFNRTIATTIQSICEASNAG